MKVIVKINDDISKEEVQNWIDEVLLENPCVKDAHIACEGCTCRVIEESADN